MIRHLLYSAVLIFVVAELRGQEIVPNSSLPVCAGHADGHSDWPCTPASESIRIMPPEWVVRKMDTFIFGGYDEHDGHAQRFTIQLGKQWRCHQRITRHSIGLTCTKGAK